MFTLSGGGRLPVKQICYCMVGDYEISHFSEATNRDAARVREEERPDAVREREIAETRMKEVKNANP